MASQRQNDSSAGYQPLFKSFATDAIHVGSEPEQWNSRAGFEYSRSGNPTRNCLERAVAALDGAQYCLALSSGMAATLTVTHLFKAGDGILCMNDVYGGTNEYLSKITAEFGLDVSFADLTKLVELKAALKPNTKMLWIETPTNPTLKVVDIKGCADIVHEYNKDIIVVVDNTFMSSYFQRPLALGADICMYSETKYMNGHSDIVMGLISLSRDDIYKRLKFLQSGKDLSFSKVSMTHVSVAENEKNELGISDTLIRLSVGLKDEENIIADLDQALAAAEYFSSPYGTGFFAEYAEKIPGESTKVLLEAANDCGVYLVGGSIPEEESCITTA